jgi:hypothetical protein
MMIACIFVDPSITRRSKWDLVFDSMIERVTRRDVFTGEDKRVGE